MFYALVSFMLYDTCKLSSKEIGQTAVQYHLSEVNEYLIANFVKQQN